MARVGAVSTNPDLLVSAFDDGKGGSALVMLNRSVTPQRVSIHWTGREWQQVERTSPYLDNADSAPGAASAQDQVIQPGEILTLSTAAAPVVP
jgi:hypothetical protein